jgi:integrase
MPVHYDTRNKRWRFAFNRVVGGRRYRSSRLLPASWDRARAEAYARQEEGRLYALAAGIEQPRRLISEAVALYVKHRLPALKNGKKAGLDLAHLLTHLEGHELADLGDVARTYVAAHPELAPATVRNRLAYLRAAVRYAYRHHQLGDRDYSDRMVMPTVRNERQVYLQATDMERLARACADKDMRAVIRIAYYTGCRWISEILPRQPEDVIRNRTGTWLVVPDTKTGEPKMVPVHPAIRRDLERLPFPARNWRDYYAEFEAARKKAKLPHVVMHDLRHSTASALISAGESLHVVGQVLGHKTAQSTARYAHLYPKAAAAAMKRMPTAKRARKAA